MHEEIRIAIRETVIKVIIFLGLNNKIPINTKTNGNSLRLRYTGW